MNSMATRTGHLITLDWGTTNVRAALLNETGEVVEQRCGESGVGHYSSSQFEARFDELTKDWPAVPALAAGMIGSRQGWKEAKYLSCPNHARDLCNNLTTFSYKDRTVAIVPGLQVDRDGHLDVMRGEETQVAGYLASQPEFSGTIVLPGTHSKWVQIRKATIEYFTTYMTGEMFDVLTKNTILRHSVEHTLEASDTNEAAATAAFSEAVSDVFVGKGSDIGRFFHLRASTLLKGCKSETVREQLSGTLIGMELKAAVQDGYDVQSLVVIGSGPLIDRYHRAAQVLGASMESFEGSTLVWNALFSLAQTAKLQELKV